MARAKPSGIKLNEDDAAIAKGMLKRGDRQHDIAAWFGVNGGRIAELSTGDTFSYVSAATDGLPPPGPYLSGRGSARLIDALNRIRGEVSQVLDEIDELISEADE